MTRKALLDVVGVLALAALVVLIAGPPLLAQKERGGVAIAELKQFKGLFERHMMAAIEVNAKRPGLPGLYFHTKAARDYIEKTLIKHELAKGLPDMELRKVTAEVLAEMEKVIRAEGKDSGRFVRDLRVEKDFCTLRAFKNLALVKK